MGKKAELEAMQVELTEVQETLEHMSANLAEMSKILSASKRRSEELRERIAVALKRK